MENNSATQAFPTAEAAALSIRETLLKVCRHYQEPGLGAAYRTVAHYYEKQVEAIPTPTQLPQPDASKLRP